MRILVLGSGGREHALVWRLARDSDVASVLAAPGNPGIAVICPCFPIDLGRPADVLALAEAQDVDLTVVGPEAPLELGLADLFRSRGRAVVGPSRAGAALECSKVYAKRFMARHGIPTARFVVCESADEALAAIGRDFAPPVVVKADGLAAGKGVVVATGRDEAEAAIRSIMIDRQFGASGDRVVIEECLTGPEVSSFFLCDGHRALALSTAEDHKRIFDDDRGPNTGGMGAFAPSPRMTDVMADFVMREIVDPVLGGMRADGESYRGFLYVSLMLTTDGPKVIEFNVRFGDPEAQVVLPLIDGPFGRVLADAAAGRLSPAQSGISIGADRMVGVVLASRGYPASSESDVPIEGLGEVESIPNALVFHAGTRAAGDRIVTAGGRVLTVVGRGSRYEDAMRTAYRAADAIRFDGMQFRRDIGRKAIAAEQEIR